MRFVKLMYLVQFIIKIREEEVSKVSSALDCGW